MQVGGFPGRFPKQDGVVGDEFAVLEPATARGGLVNADAPPCLT
jgi:hypothetical protein